MCSLKNNAHSKLKTETGAGYCRYLWQVLVKLPAGTGAGQIMTCFPRFFTDAGWLFEDQLSAGTSVNLSQKRSILFKVIYFHSKSCFDTKEFY